MRLKEKEQKEQKEKKNKKDQAKQNNIADNTDLQSL